MIILDSSLIDPQRLVHPRFLEILLLPDSRLLLLVYVLLLWLDLFIETTLTFIRHPL